MNSLVNECLKTIDAIDTTSYEAEIAVCESLLETYEKAATILECYNGDDLSPFSCFMESAVSVVQEADDEEKLWEFEARKDKKDGSGKENIIISILAFIPRLIYAIGKFIVRGLKKVFSGKSVNEAREKQIVEAVKMSKKEKRESKAQSGYDTLVDAIRSRQDSMLNGSEGTADSNGVSPFAIALNESLFDEENFDSVSSGIGEDFAFYIYPPVDMEAFNEKLREYQAGITGACNATFHAILNAAKTPGEKAVEANIKPIVMAAVGPTHNGGLAKDFGQFKKNAKDITSVQDRTRKADVSVNGVSSGSFKITPKEYYKQCEEMSKITKIIVDDAKAINKSVEEMRTNGVPLTDVSDQGLTDITDCIKTINSSIAEVTGRIFSISKAHNQVLEITEEELGLFGKIKKHTTGMISSAINTAKEFLTGKKETDRDKAVDRQKGTFKEVSRNEDRSSAIGAATEALNNESAVEELGNAFYQNENIEASAY